MSRVLASVRNRDEARRVLAAGVDIIDLKEPDDGALGAVPVAVMRAVVAEVAGRVPVSATIGDITAVDDAIAAVTRTAASGVDIVKIGFFPGLEPRELIPRLAPLAGEQRLVAVLFAEQGSQIETLPQLAAAGFYGAMLDTGDKQAGGLRRQLADVELAAFVVLARQYGLLTGLAGSLRLEDIAPLCRLEPDYLGFRGALCAAGRRRDPLDEQALARVVATVRAHGAHGLAREPVTLAS